MIRFLLVKRLMKHLSCMKVNFQKENLNELAISIARGLSSNPEFIKYVMYNKGFNSVGEEIAEKTKDAVSEITW